MRRVWGFGFGFGFMVSGVVWGVGIRVELVVFRV